MKNSPEKDPEPVSPGVVSNIRKMKVCQFSPIQSKGYLESKVVKVEQERKPEASTSTPKKKENKRNKLKETNKRTKEILNRLETKIGVTVAKVDQDEKPTIQKKNKVSRTYLITLPNFIILLPGCRSINPIRRQYFNLHSTSGGNKIYTVAFILWTLFISSISHFPSLILHFQVPVHRRSLLQVLPNFINLQHSTYQKSVRFYDVKMPVVISNVRDSILLFSVI